MEFWVFTYNWQGTWKIIPIRQVIGNPPTSVWTCCYTLVMKTTETSSKESHPPSERHTESNHPNHRGTKHRWHAPRNQRSIFLQFFLFVFAGVLRVVIFSKSSYPIGSMGLVYLPTFGWIFMVNVGEYTIHGSYEYKHPSMQSYSQLMIGCPFSPPKRMAFRFHETILQKVIGSLGSKGIHTSWRKGLLVDLRLFAWKENKSQSSYCTWWFS